MPDKKLIPRAFYKKIITAVPLPCVDVVVKRGRKFLLVKRKNKPSKGKWWMIGGRINRRERILEAVRRKVSEEANIRRIKKIKFLGFDETIFKDSPFGVGIHTVNLTFLAEVEQDNKKESGGDGNLRWFTKIDPAWSGYVKKFLRLAGFK